MPNRDRRTAIFRRASATTLDESGMMSRATRVPKHVAAQLAKLADDQLDSGSQLRVLYRGADSGGFSLVHVWFKAGYELPRHTHNVDCLYYVVSGELVMGSQRLGPGDGFFVPAEKPYAYRAGENGVEVLEFRHAIAFDVRVLGLDLAVVARASELRAAHASRWSGDQTPPSWRPTPTLNEM